MALSNLFSWGKAARAAASSACGAGDKPDKSPLPAALVINPPPVAAPAAPATRSD